MLKARVLDEMRLTATPLEHLALAQFFGSDGIPAKIDNQTTDSILQITSGRVRGWTGARGNLFIEGQPLSESQSVAWSKPFPSNRQPRFPGGQSPRCRGVFSITVALSGSTQLITFIWPPDRGQAKASLAFKFGLSRASVESTDAPDYCTRWGE